MAQSPNDNNEAKGFSGLGSMVSDVSDEVKQASQVPPAREPSSNQGRTSNASEPSRSSPEKPQPTTTQTPQTSGIQASAAPSGSSGSKWVFGGIAALFVFWMIGNSGKQTNPPYSPPPTYETPTPARVAPASPTPVPKAIVPSTPSVSGEKPPIGDGFVFNREQMRYCLTEKIRIDAVEKIVNGSRSHEVDQFNAIVTDYNGRCGHFKYRRGLLESVKSEVNSQQAEIEQAAQSAWVRNTLGLESTPRPKAARSARASVATPAGTSNFQETRTTDSAPSPSGSPKTLQELASPERESLEAACSQDKYLNGPAAYNQCVNRQLASLEKGSRRPTLDGLSTSEKESIEAACSQDKYLNGPASYNRCLKNQMSSLKGKSGRPSLASLSNAEKESIEAACSQDKYLNGPAAYNSCLNNQLASLERGVQRPSMASLSSRERESIESACSQDKYLNGPAAYNACLARHMSTLRTR